MEVLLLAVMAASNIVCFIIGAKVGQAVSKGERIETPAIDPLKAYREHEAKREAQKEQERLDAIMRNIEAYDGTGAGQEDVPRG
jgi:hypothetical protein